MNTRILYAFDPTDPPLQFVNDCICRLSSFIAYDAALKSFTKGTDAKFLKAHIWVCVANEFSEQDVRDVAEFLKELAGRAQAKYKDVDPEDAPWRDSVLQAATNAVTAADELLKIFYNAAPNLKPIPEAPKA
jgi:hypothetical protein